MRTLVCLSLVLLLDLASLNALTAEPAALRGTIAADSAPIRKVYPL